MKKHLKRLANATSTPLASIFGSGVLIIIPILAGAAGAYSVVAMAAICALAYAVGSVIRYNIIHAEPVLADRSSEATESLERISDLALVIAYVISVSLYLHILSSFVLGSVGMDTELNENLMTTGIIAAIMVIGLTKGLDTLEGLEKWALAISVLMIILLILGFSHYDWAAGQSASGIILPKAKTHTPWEILTIIAGTLIVVQGYETTRYLGQQYDANVRISASRWSQIISTSVYIVFVAVAMPVVHTLYGQYDDNSLIKLTSTVSSLLVAPLVIVAALSQFSAAVADSLAATGNMQEVTQNRLKARWGIILVGGGAIALTWSANTFEIVAIASRSFAFYYLLQCLVAITVSQSIIQRTGMLAIALVLAFITVFAIPAN